MEYYTRMHGYARKGERIEKEISGRKFERKSMISLLNEENEIIEPLIYEGTATSELINAYFRNALKGLEKGSIVVMDNASIHKSEGLKKIFDDYGIVLKFLPPYSPQLNPIEKIQGVIKRNLRNYYDKTLTLFENLQKILLPFYPS